MERCLLPFPAGKCLGVLPPQCKRRRRYSHPCLQQTLLHPGVLSWNEMSEDAQDLGLGKHLRNKTLLTCTLTPSTALVALLTASSRYRICQRNLHSRYCNLSSGIGVTQRISVRARPQILVSTQPDLANVLPRHPPLQHSHYSSAAQPGLTP